MEGNLTGHKCCARLIVSLVTVLWLCTPAAAKPLGEVTLNYIEAATSADRLSNQVKVYLTVSDTADKSVPGLGRKAFEIVEDGRPMKVAKVSKATDAMSVILAIDTSGSMQARDKSGRTSMDAARNAAVEFVSLLGRQDKVAIFAFNNEPELRLDFTPNHRTAISAIRKIAARHNAATCLYDTAYAAIKKAAEVPKGRRAIVLLTDGRDEKGKKACSRYTSNDVIDAATTKAIRVPIYTIGAGPQVDERELGRIASFTGGRHLQAATMKELSGFFKAIAEQLKNQYVIQYDTRTPSGEHSLVLKVRQGGKTVQDEKRFWSPPLPVIKAPEIAFKSLVTSGPVEGIQVLNLKIKPKNTVKKVRYYVDASLKEERTAAPFDAFRFDTAGLPGGLHIVRAEVLDIHGQSVSTEMTLTVKAPPPKVSPAVKPAKAPAQAAQPAGSGLNPALLAAGCVVLLVIAVLVGWSLRKRGESASGGGSMDDDEDDADETMFVANGEMPVADSMAGLKVVASDSLEVGKVFKITGTTRIGRTAKNDIDIPDKSVSRKHAEIYYENNAYHIRDLGSQNGLKVDGTRVSLTGMQLKNGFKIRFGPKTVLEFEWDNADAEATEIAPDDSTKIYE